jgi:hypothetical protein
MPQYRATLQQAFHYWRKAVSRLVDTHGRDYADRCAYRLAREYVWPEHRPTEKKLPLP